jgi:hypothetical protein
MMVSPGFAYEKAPDQEHFLDESHATNMLDEVLQHPRAKRWRFNQSPLYLQFLRGRWEMDCTPWGSPTFNIFGWQKPCYLIDEGYATSYGELLAETDWAGYGHRSGNPKCAQCMTHCGFEPTAVAQTLTTWRGLTATMRAMFGRGALPLVHAQPAAAGHASHTLTTPVSGSAHAVGAGSGSGCGGCGASGSCAKPKALVHIDLQPARPSEHSSSAA